MIDVAVIGASGYGGGELLRWLALHPEARVAVATSRTYAGKPASASFPGMAGLSDLVFQSDVAPADLSGCAVVFLARDNGVAMNMAPELLKVGCRVIDISADFRFRDASVYNEWYPAKHTSPELTKTAVYGLPELHRDEIVKARVVGNPGCYTTTSILSLAPLMANGLADPDSIIIDGKSGVSGAGRSKHCLAYHYAEVTESASAYKIGGTHRHTPEIEQELSSVAGRQVRVSFTPHLVPMTRGILATCYASLERTVTADELREVYRAFYAKAPFVYVSDGLPATKHVVATNMCHIGLAVDDRTRRVTVVSVTDNLGKGMAGQAIQNMNLMMGFDETTGLRVPGLWP